MEPGGSSQKALRVLAPLRFNIQLFLTACDPWKSLFFPVLDNA
jgi:hypothetical protein